MKNKKLNVKKWQKEYRELMARQKRSIIKKY